MKKETCEVCLGRFTTVVAQLVHAEEFALHDETERALGRLRWAEDNKKIMDSTGCLMSAESKITDHNLAKLGDAIATRDKYKIAELTTDTADHLLKALRYKLCETGI